ncbi:Abi family protein [Corynebacterium sp. SCR221107]|nr:Abi family protein [Corynebacterium sp. SCR221107]WBT09014.1 Abi family protein [Corynebacterium sp. SCR221107]
MPISYDKPFLTIGEQIQKLSRNGLQFINPEEAEKLLREIGYYRLSGYWFNFRELDSPSTYKTSKGKILQKRKSTFRADSKFEDAVALYQFDDELRQKVFEGIRAIEISLRSEIGHVLGMVSAFAHCDPSCLAPEFTKFNSGRPPGLLHADWAISEHAKWLKQVDKEERRSSDVFIEHFEDKYGRPLPVWVMTEILAFGTLSTLFSGMKQNSKDRLAVSYRIVDDRYVGDGSTMANWINHLRYIRNVCAHHSRLWNRNITSQLGAPPQGVAELAHLGNADRSRVYCSLAIIAYLLEKIQPQHPWRLEIVQFCKDGARENGFDLEAMGFPAVWEYLELWSPVYRNSCEDKLEKRRLFGSVETMQPQEIGSILRSEAPPKKRLDYLRYLRKQHKLIGIQETNSFEYPSFQIDLSHKKIHDCVARANERLLAVFAGTDDASWHALKWWLTPVDPNGLTPKTLLEQGRLTPEQVDDLLPPGGGGEPLSTTA